MFSVCAGEVLQESVGIYLRFGMRTEGERNVRNLSRTTDLWEEGMSTDR